MIERENRCGINQYLSFSIILSLYHNYLFFQRICYVVVEGKKRDEGTYCERNRGRGEKGEDMREREREGEKEKERVGRCL